MTAPSTTEPIAPPDHVGRAAAFDARRTALDAASRRLAALRLALAVIALAAFARWWMAGGWILGLAAAASLAFVVVAVRHARVDARAKRAARLADINRDADARWRRDWRHVTEWQPAGAADPRHPYTADLDVLGHASLMSLLGRARSGPGDRRLGEWALAPGTVERIRARQLAARALQERLEWRQELAADAIDAAGLRPAELARFLDWCERRPWLHARPWLYAVCVAMTGLVPAAVIATWSGRAAPGLASALLLVSLVLSLLGLRRYHHNLEDASWEVALRGWRAMFRRIASLPDTGTLVDEWRAKLLEDGIDAAAALDQLDRVIGAGSLRHTPLLHWPIQLLTLWDAHVWWALERWQVAHGPRVRGWIDAVAEVEALAALAGLAADHPGWTWPEVDVTAVRLEADALAHPLIAPVDAVPNDVLVGPPGRTLLVTGSNMSGKSTLLRAVGLNAVLALMGGPVCARRLCLPLVRVVTSMRLADSLEDGVSFFMASLARLKLVVDAATAPPDVPPVLYLLDELLAGTNSAERAIAVRAVLTRLLESRAIGAVTTHNLAIAEAPELHRRATCVHFKETVERRDGRVHMTFDYRLRPGVASSTNALALMEVIGLGDVLVRAHESLH